MEGGESFMFESSHVLGSLLASSTLLPRSWQLCLAAESAVSGFAVDSSSQDGVVYVAFSGAREVESGWLATAKLEGEPAARALFSPLLCCDDEDDDGGDDGHEPVMVQALALRRYLDLASTRQFEILMEEIKGKRVVFTGHSFGGCVAALAALRQLCSPPPSPSSSSSSLLCITFGSPLLGNAALCRAVLRERWCGSFCHVVAQHDVVPRLPFCPFDAAQKFASDPMPPEQLAEHIRQAALEERWSSASCSSSSRRRPYVPFGCFVLCSPDGVVCVDNPSAVVQMLHLTFVARGPGPPAAAHLCYGDLCTKISENLLLKRRGSMRSADIDGVSLALEASGIGNTGEGAAEARQSMEMWRTTCQSPSLRCAQLARSLAKITPRRAQIEWYKACFDGDMGYYDAFKLRRSPKKYTSANMNRLKLGNFWDDVIAKLESARLPHDFQKRSKWVNAAQFYKLLVEPLDIADYYRSQKHQTRGHYVSHGRPRRYEVFDRWWKGREEVGAEEDKRRSKFAGLTQDSCFWAKVEEATEWVEAAAAAKERGDEEEMGRNWMRLAGFESYSSGMVARKEVSVDVLAPNSSYCRWLQLWHHLQLTTVAPRPHST